MALNDIVQARIVTTLGNQTAFCIRHYKSTVYAGTADTRQALATAIDAALFTAWKFILSNEATYRGVGVKRILPLPATIESFTIVNAGIGAAASTALPKQTAGVISLRTAFAGRAFRGRSYFPFPSEIDNLANGLPGPSLVTSLNTIGTILIASRAVTNGATSETWTPVVYHRNLGTTDVLVAAIGRSIWGTQRRRGDFGQQNVSPF